MEPCNWLPGPSSSGTITAIAPDTISTPAGTCRPESQIVTLMLMVLQAMFEYVEFLELSRCLDKMQTQLQNDFLATLKYVPSTKPNLCTCTACLLHVHELDPWGSSRPGNGVNKFIALTG